MNEKFFDEFLMTVDKAQAKISESAMKRIMYGGTLNDTDKADLAMLINLKDVLFAGMNKNGILILKEEKEDGTWLSATVNNHTYSHKISDSQDMQKMETHTASTPVAEESPAVEENKEPFEPKKEATAPIQEKVVEEEPEKVPETHEAVDTFVPQVIEDDWNDEHKEDESESESFLSENTEGREEIASTSDDENYYKLTVFPNLEEEIFKIEQSKKKNTFVYDTYRLTVGHRDTSDKDELFCMIAPLEIPESSMATAPIIVTLIDKNRNCVTTTSLENSDPGRKSVVIEIGEYAFLVRGNFTEDGEFKSSIYTHGISTENGDILTCIGKKEHRPEEKVEGSCGHIKFPFLSSRNTGSLNAICEVFPFDDDEENFIIMIRDPEFIDYLYSLKGSFGTKKAFIWAEGDMPKREILCGWENNSLNVDIIEA